MCSSSRRLPLSHKRVQYFVLRSLNTLALWLSYLASLSLSLSLNRGTFRELLFFSRWHNLKGNLTSLHNHRPNERLDHRDNQAEPTVALHSIASRQLAMPVGRLATVAQSNRDSQTLSRYDWHLARISALGGDSPNSVSRSVCQPVEVALERWTDA